MFIKQPWLERDSLQDWFLILFGFVVMMDILNIHFKRLSRRYVLKFGGLQSRNVGKEVEEKYLEKKKFRTKQKVGLRARLRFLTISQS